MQFIGRVTLLVKDYEEAIRFYTECLNFDVIEDTTLTIDKRWVVVAPKGSMGCALILAKASTIEQINCIGNQSGGRVFLFLYTDDIERDVRNLITKGVEIVRPIKNESYGKVLVFADLYGNLWDLIENH